MSSRPMNQVALFIKVMILGGLVLAFGIPLLMVNQVMVERGKYHGQVLDEVAKSTAGPQTITGPLLVVRYRERLRPQPSGVTNAQGRPIEAVQVVDRERVIVPESLDIRAGASVEQRRRGIYKAHLFSSNDTLAARFRIPARDGLPDDPDIIDIQPAQIVVEVTDSRGLHHVPVATVDGHPVDVHPGSELMGGAHGFSFAAGPSSTEERTLDVRIALDLIGTENLSFTPVGKDTRVELTSRWPHPSFKGAFIPEQRTVGGAGFTARWQLSQFATNAAKLAEECENGDCMRLKTQSFGVSFVQPVDIYQQSQRAVKYGMLFVLLTFMSFFLFEVLKRLPVHYIQYGLVGIALVLFFLLLISLSEHVPFALAYAAATVACVGLLTFYVGHVLKSFARSLAFGGMLATLYIVLYVLLLSEDFALLLGSLLLFALLALVMTITRRVDWYRLGDASASEPTP